MNYNENNLYYLVRGWYDNNGGIYDDSFYGACAEPADYLTPKMCVLHGLDAYMASEVATKQSCRVHPSEIMDSYDRENPPTHPDYLDKKNHLTDKEKERTQHMLLDKGDEDEEDGDEVPTELWVNEIKKEVVSELTGTGSIASGPLDSILSNPSTNKSRLGMSDRGGHGHVDNEGPTKVNVGSNFLQKGKTTLKGFSTSHRSNSSSSSAGTGSSGSLPTISQASTGRRGGGRR